MLERCPPKRDTDAADSDSDADAVGDGDGDGGADTFAVTSAAQKRKSSTVGGVSKTPITIPLTCRRLQYCKLIHISQTNADMCVGRVCR